MGAERRSMSSSPLGFAWRCRALTVVPVLLILLALASALWPKSYGQVDDAPVTVPDRDARGNSGYVGPTLVDDRSPPQAVAEPQVQLPPIDLQGRIKDIVVAPSRAGDVVRVQTDGGGWVELTPEQYVRALHDTQLRVENGGLLYRWLNITSPLSLVWVCVGLLGQVMFTFRMVLQWWASEKHKRVIVPTAFWWGSLAGGALLFAYFCWRKDVVGVIGQSTGVFIYARNLVLIYRGKRIEAEGARPLDGGGHAVEENVAAPHAT
jgi:lipid-A-disaccharide synthase-like uncharacterized protein